MDSSAKPDPEKPTPHLLLVSQQATLNDEQQDALKVIAARHKLDVATTRQRLLGGSLALLCRGARKTLDKIVAILREAKVDAWIVQPSRPRFAPTRVRSLQREANSLTLVSKQEEIHLDRDTRAVAVLADISGKLADKQLKRLVAHNIYLGTTPQQGLSPEESISTILQGVPVLDLYLLDDKDRIRSALRVLPGKFNPAGLDDLKTISARQNFETVLRLIRENANILLFDTSFGVSQIPKLGLCRPRETNDWQEENLRRLTRFGWLMTDLALEQERTRPEGGPEASVGGVVTATLLGRPELATAGIENLPGVGEVAQEINDAIAEQPTHQDVEASTSALPAPPPHRANSRLHRKTIISVLAGAGILALFVSFEFGDTRLARWVFQHGLQNGLFPGLASIGLFWAGFHYLRLQRRIANTPTSKIRSLAMGLVELHGIARRRYALVSPLSQMPCVYYRLRKYRLENRNNRRQWRLTSDTDSGHVPFFLEDTTGRVTVDPLEARVRATHRQEGYPGESGSILFGSGYGGSASEKWVEHSIPEGRPLYVLGTAEPVRMERPSLRERTVEKLRDLKRDKARMQQYDADGDGQIDETEWQTAQDAMQDEALREQLATDEKPADAATRVVIGRGPHRSLPFIIAQTTSEEDLIGRYRWFAWPLLIASLLCALFAVWRALVLFAF